MTTMIAALAKGYNNGDAFKQAMDLESLGKVCRMAIDIAQDWETGEQSDCRMNEYIENLVSSMYIMFDREDYAASAAIVAKTLDDSMDAEGVSYAKMVFNDIAQTAASIAEALEGRGRLMKG